MRSDATDSERLREDSVTKKPGCKVKRLFLGREVTDEEFASFGRALDRYFSILEEWDREDEA